MFGRPYKPLTPFQHWLLDSHALTKASWFLYGVGTTLIVTGLLGMIR